jgi:dipeptidyl aminopeptidase
VLEKNDRLNNATQEYEAATIVQSTFVNEGYGELYLYIYPQFIRSADLLTYLILQSLLLGPCNVLTELNVKEIRPPRMDDSGRTKYPVMFRV